MGTTGPSWQPREEDAGGEGRGGGGLPGPRRGLPRDALRLARRVPAKPRPARPRGPAASPSPSRVCAEGPAQSERIPGPPEPLTTRGRLPAPPRPLGKGAGRSLRRAVRAIQRARSPGLQPRGAGAGLDGAPGWPWAHGCLSPRSPVSREAGSARATAPRPGDSAVTRSQGARSKGRPGLPRLGARRRGRDTRGSPRSPPQKREPPHTRLYRRGTRGAKRPRTCPGTSAEAGAGWGAAGPGAPPPFEARASGGADGRTDGGDRLLLGVTSGGAMGVSYTLRLSLGTSVPRTTQVVTSHYA